MSLYLDAIDCSCCNNSNLKHGGSEMGCFRAIKPES